jgi:hypothetical protein
MALERPPTLADSPLAAFGLEKLDEGDALITCPRCGNSAVVHLATWLTGNQGGTRPCTYCFKTAKIPEDVPTTPPVKITNIEEAYSTWLLLHEGEDMARGECTCQECIPRLASLAHFFGVRMDFVANQGKQRWG